MLRTAINTESTPQQAFVQQPSFSNGEKYKLNELILKVENVSLKLGDNQILKDVNIEVRNVIRPGISQGQVIGLLAPSGIGKTKLFEILSGLRKPDTGRVLIDVKQTPVEVGQVGVVYQSYPLFNHLNVQENLLIGAKKKFGKNAKEAVSQIITQFGLEGKEKLFPMQLSGGQRQRVAISQQLLCSEHFLLLDEPFSGLDVLMIKKVLKVLTDISLKDELNTMIIVSHDIVSTASISDTLWIMGRDRDSNNQIIPGAKIKHVIDLMEQDLCWRPDIKSEPKFIELVKYIESMFESL